VSKKSKTPIQFQQQENTPRRQHEAIQEGTQQEHARAKKNSPRQKEADRRLPQISTLCLARDDEEEEEELEEKKYLRSKKGFERKRNCDSSSSSSHNSLTFQREREEYYRPGVYHRQVVVRGILRHN
jgi:hypothetical protein